MWLLEFLTNKSLGITRWLQPYGYVGAGRSLSDGHKAIKGDTDFAQGPQWSVRYFCIHCKRKGKSVWGPHTALPWFHPKLATAAQERRSKSHKWNSISGYFHTKPSCFMLPSCVHKCPPYITSSEKLMKWLPCSPAKNITEILISRLSPK